jgi:NhaA family Na+:H+ antiporter
LAALVSVKSGVADLPTGISWPSFLGYACLTGIGFTMSLFIATLAFRDAQLVNAAKLGIISGSLLAGIVATIILATVKREDTISR